MSAGEALRAAVRQRLSAALEDVLALVQSTVARYEAQLSREERPEAVVSSLSTIHCENSPQGHIKEEQPELWSIQDQVQLRASRSTQSRAQPERCQDQHGQQRKTESEDSDEECPICKRLDLHQRPPSSGPNSDRGPAQTASAPSETSKKTTEESAHCDEDVKPAVQEQRRENPQELDSMDVKTEDEDGGRVPGQEKTSEISVSVSMQEEGEESGRGLKRTAPSQDELTVSKHRKTLSHSESQGERGKTTREVETAEGSSSENPSGENELPLEGPGEKEAQVETNALQALEGEVPPEKSCGPAQKKQDMFSEVDKAETEDQTVQGISKQQPTVKLVPLKLVQKTVTGKKPALLAESHQTRTSGKPKRLSQTNTKKQSKDRTKQTPSGLCERRGSTPATPEAKDQPQPRASPSPQRDAEPNTKEDDPGNEGGTFRRKLSRKAKARKAERTKGAEANGGSDSGSDTDKDNDSDYKVDKTTDSEGSDERPPKVRVKKSFRNRSPAVRLSEASQKPGLPQDALKAKGAAPGPPRKKSDEKHECAECGSTFSLKRNLLLHSVVHQDERPFSCSACGATFKRKLNLKVHMATHSAEKDFHCPVCQKSFTRKCNLDDHLRAHSGEKPYGCSACGRSFTCRSNLRRHAASHSGLRPFDCEVCGKRFGRKSILLEHMTAHTGERAFSCSLCDTKFSRKHNLLKHTRIHKGERRYRCSECSAAFSQKAHLDQHRLRHTGEKPYQCTVCQKGFTRKAYVQQHLDMYCLGPAEGAAGQQ